MSFDLTQEEPVTTGSVMGEDRDTYVAEMMAKGFSIMVPKANELFIDLDTEGQYDRFQVMWTSFSNRFLGAIADVRPSASGYPKRHVYVTLPFEVTEVERIAWQSILCSDPYRELCSMVRVMTGSLPATIFKEIR